MAFPDDPVSQGYDRGVSLAQDFDLIEAVSPGTDNVVGQALGTARRLLSAREANERSTVLFTELVTVAALARSVNHEPTLTDMEIEEYLLSTARFTNSWFGWFCRDEDR